MDFKNILFCVAGLSLTFSYDDLSYKKNATQSHTAYAGWFFFYARNAIDRNAGSCMKAKDIGHNSLAKSVWWKVDLGRVYSIYSVDILFKNYTGYMNRQRGRFAGFSLYVSNTNNIKGSTLCYKDGHQLPPLNFTNTCTERGRYIIFYNERLDGVTYPDNYEVTNVITELCEVVVKGCDQHVYGRSCNKSCPINCQDNICHIQHGTCFVCMPGWMGTFCNTRCRERWYGVNCSQLCIGHCRDNTTCNHVTGQCDKGCDAGWTGLKCDRECVDGTYGYACVKNCSGHCQNESSCNKETGYCDRGCNPGYTDNDCRLECVKSYGENCKHPCSQHCINQTCDRFTGKCLSWCQAGFYGEKCKQACQWRNQYRELVTPWVVAFSIVFCIVLLLITGGLFFLRILYKRLFNGDIRLCWKSLFQSDSLTTTTSDKTTDYKEPNPITNSNYQELNPNSIYQELNPHTNYQQLKLPHVDENEYQNTAL